MDYRTGIVGLPPREICLKGLCELLEVSKRYTSNNKTEVHTVKMVRTALGQLERSGLIQRLPGIKKNDVETLVFKLKMATTDKSVSNSEGRGQGRGKGRRKVNNGAGFTHSQGRGSNPSEGTHPVNPIKKNKTTAVDNLKSVDNFPASHPTTVSGVFTPGQDTRDLCIRARCPTITSNVVGLFVAHHKSRDTRSHDWQACFYKWMLIRKEMKTRSAKKNVGRKQAWEVVPRDNDKLWAWAKQHGYPDPGLDTHFQYRQRLKSCVEKRRVESGHTGYETER